MSSQKRTRRKLNIEDTSFDFEDVFETGGLVLSGNRCIELVRDAGSLALMDSSKRKPLERIDFHGQTFVPPTLAPSILEALTLPTKRADCGSTVELFAQLRNLFIDYGVTEDAAQASAYFAIASWFSEFLPVAPCLVLTGGQPEAYLLLELLACLVRHALPLAEINMATFYGLPMHVQPTLLIRHVQPSIWRVLFSSNHPRAFLTHKDGIIDLYCVKAAYAGSTVGMVNNDAVLDINCAPSDGKLPVILGPIQEKITATFQPMLLDYRFKYVEQVRMVDFDAPTLPSRLRMLAKSLGSCVIDAPELRAGIIRLLENQEEERRENRLLDPNRIAVEALFALCHSENGPARVGVSQIATTAAAILTNRGESAAFDSKGMGGHLRLLGFRAKRDSKGYAIHLTPDVRHLINSLAHEHQVGDSEERLSPEAVGALPDEVCPDPAASAPSV